MPETASATYLRSSRLLEVNPVSLSLFRIALGACVLLHIWLTLPHYTTFFTDDGVLPRSVVTQVWNKPEILSVLLLGDHPLLHSGFMVVYVLAAVCFCIGYHTWLANILLVCCVLSLNWRNPLISGEVTGHASLLLKLLLIWCCFLPYDYRSAAFTFFWSYSNFPGLTGWMDPQYIMHCWIMPLPDPRQDYGWRSMQQECFLRSSPT